MNRLLLVVILGLFTATVVSAQAKPATPAQDKTKAKDKDAKGLTKEVLVGKWRITENGNAKQKANFEGLAQMGVYFEVEYRANGTWTMSISADDKAKLAMFTGGKPNAKLTCEAKFRIHPGNKVEIYDVRENGLNMTLMQGKVHPIVTVVDDAMTVNEPDGGTTKLVRVKPEKTKLDK